MNNYLSNPFVSAVMAFTMAVYTHVNGQDNTLYEVDKGTAEAARAQLIAANSNLGQLQDVHSVDFNRFLNNKGPGNSGPGLA